jgi:hypothetical protein
MHRTIIFLLISMALMIGAYASANMDMSLGLWPGHDGDVVAGPVYAIKDANGVYIKDSNGSYIIGAAP